ncbi:unnamed protein product [Toxocara canis]|uniref:ShKT domain-containing protein n=1 Tax=Toxocara canis TaxID=6265 RepID=A0A183VBZ4_TOXCA|nr:unnamed protein product [Toxocara canis]
MVALATLLAVFTTFGTYDMCLALYECKAPQNTDFGCVDTHSEKGLCEYLFGAKTGEKSRIACTDSNAVAVSLAQRCLKTCKMCCRDPRYNCQDKNITDLSMKDFCTNIKQLNLCGDRRDDEVTLLLASECPMSCGYCDYGGYGQCANKESTDTCRKLANSCNHPTMGSYVKSICKFTCGDCIHDGAVPQRSTPKL